MSTTVYIERAYCGSVRADDSDGLRISGIVVAYDQAHAVSGMRESIRRGAFHLSDESDVVLNRQHDRARPLARTRGGGLTLHDSSTSLRMTADLVDTAEARDTWRLVDAGVLHGLSVEMYVLADAVSGGQRIITQATLTGSGVVDTPAYGDSVVSARHRRLGVY